MRRLIVAALLAIVFSCSGSHAADIPVNSMVSTCFSPHGRCEDLIVKEINSAQTNIYIMAYGFTAKEIASALVNAKKRGVLVEVLLDKKFNCTGKYSAADFTAHMGIPTYLDGEHKIMHNKVMIIDGKTVITGSYNFTKSANNDNAENVLIMRSKELADDYFKNYQQHKAHSHIYGGR
jgi:phosphatidylserine/phosphatidylglycerophosphate/cardiolipin synthase-like enzyme